MMLRGVGSLLLAAVVLVSVGCSSLSRQAPPGAEVVDQLTPQAQEAEVQRQHWLQSHPVWSFNGRAAISRGDKGGSGRVDWHQQGDVYRIQLSAPVTRQGWTLTGNRASGSGRLDGLDGGPRAGTDAEQLLLETVGWDIPVGQLSDWVRGLVAVNGRAPARDDRDAEGRLRTMQQQGWTIEFLDWYPSAEGRPALPRRIDARNGDAKVRLVIDDWSFDAS